MAVFIPVLVAATLAAAGCWTGNIIRFCVPQVPAGLLISLFMNILIEDAEKLEYLTSSNLWTKNAAGGKNFGATGTAFAAAKKEPMGRFNIVGYIAETKQFINLNHGKGKGLPEAEAAAV
ncbi:MAG: hypothetical protein PHY43_06215 [Verrucomicrobiales bacterium]|nr:hypothetical protein [Verrucomicrobiales bacterium]